jgi:hypothetical protein
MTAEELRQLSMKVGNRANTPPEVALIIICVDPKLGLIGWGSQLPANEAMLVMQSIVGSSAS